MKHRAVILLLASGSLFAASVTHSKHGEAQRTLANSHKSSLEIERLVNLLRNQSPSEASASDSDTNRSHLDALTQMLEIAGLNDRFITRYAESQSDTNSKNINVEIGELSHSQLNDVLEQLITYPRRSQIDSVSLVSNKSAQSSQRWRLTFDLDTSP